MEETTPAIALRDIREHISASQVKTFKQCPARYVINYIIHSDIVRSLANPATFGDAIHKTIDGLAKYAAEQQQNKGVMMCRVPFSVVTDHWHKMIAKFPGIVNEYYVERGERQLRYWYDQECDREAVILGSEMHVDTYLPNGILLKFIIDRIERNRYSEYINFVDWKTGYMQEDHSLQMAIYKIGGNFLYPEALGNITTVIYFLEHEYFEPYYIDNSEMQSVYDFIAIVRDSIDQLISSVQEAVALNDNNLKFNELLNSCAKINSMCYCCDYSAQCKVYNSNIKLPVDVDVDGFIDGDVGALVDAYNKLDIQQKNIKATLAKMDLVIMAKLETAEGRQILITSGNSTGSTLRVTARNLTRINMSKIIPHLISNGKTECLSVTLKSLDAISEDLGQGFKDIVKGATYKVRGNESWTTAKLKKK